MKDEYLSQEGYKKIITELEQLKTEKRKEAAERIAHAKSFGDLSENAAYTAALESQSILEDKIAKLEDIIMRAVIVEKKGNLSVQLGSNIKLNKENDQAIYDYTLVGSEESDLANNKLSVESPIGLAVFGQKKGSSVIVKTPRGEAKYTILEIT